MFIISSDKMFVCDERFSILDNQAFVFDEDILEFGNLEDLQKKYPKAKVIKTPRNSLILPAFINTHTHLEFSANSYTLHFGDFLSWVKSVINSRQSLNQEAKDELILSMLKKMQKSGTGTVGEISSFGSDFKACLQSDMRVVFFNEILGINEALNSGRKDEFLKRFQKSLEAKNERFIPALSVHSAYSTNLELVKWTLALAKKHKLILSTHFLESRAENTWLRKASGGFKTWLRSLDENAKPLHDPKSFAKLFKEQRTLFTHCVYLNELEWLDLKCHSITHCAFSNRLLSQKSFDLRKAFKSGLNVHLGTDGLSSNISLSMLDEMRANLLIHKDFELKDFAKKLLLMATFYPARALGLDLGTLEVGKSADFSVFEIGVCDEEQLALQFILNAKEVTKLFIKGKECEF